MARGTFRKIVLSTNRKLADVRSAFGRTAAKIAKEILHDYIDRLVPDPARRSALKSKPGDLWLATVRHVYRAVAQVVRNKLAAGTLTIGPDGLFNITVDEIRPLVPDLESELRAALPV